MEHKKKRSNREKSVYVYGRFCLSGVLVSISMYSLNSIYFLC
ncbi:hypothetical protein GGGNBK_00710 [Sporosarcina sp. ANT_H38]